MFGMILIYLVNFYHNEVIFDVFLRLPSLTWIIHKINVYHFVIVVLNVDQVGRSRYVQIP